MSKENCNTCKKTPISTYNRRIKYIGAYVAITSFYGTVKLLELLFSFF